MTTSSPPQPTATQITQFLNNVLSQRGPTSLPYTEDVKWLIRQHLLTLIETYPSLQIKTATFTHNDGRTVNLLQADGTIPMIYQNVTYNIPVVIWLMETYPRHPPCVYVVPTRDMIIKRPHAHVNPSGFCSIPYLHSWVYPSSNLVDLVRNLSHLFGLDPPLYTRQSRVNPSVNENVNSSGVVLSHSHSSSDLGSSRPSTGIPPRVYSSLSSPYSGRFPPSPQRQSSMSGTDDPHEVYRKNAINKLLDTFHRDISTMRKEREVEVEGWFSVQGVLRQREDQLLKGVREMQGEKEGLEQQLQMVLMNADILEVWLGENERKAEMTNGNVNVDDVFQPSDALSKQMLDCTASDLAIEDSIYSLDKAVQEGSIPFDQYLKSIRMLSREQFFHRALLTKVRAAQMQAHVMSMAARAPQYAM
ncbi:Elc-like protein [Thalictrum thalictroides]|uniref:Elc-like protein n=1 Tax=Thalictrum thalictroides TaxID=46969 RepID=A0A7J6W7F2_THATH|nr:Elc-like protein [Thalictrum thalictroides]